MVKLLAGLLMMRQYRLGWREGRRGGRAALVALFVSTVGGASVVMLDSTFFTCSSRWGGPRPHSASPNTRTRNLYGALLVRRRVRPARPGFGWAGGGVPVPA